MQYNYRVNEYTDTVHWPARYGSVTLKDAGKRKELMLLAWTGRKNAELDVLNRALTNSPSADEIRRRIQKREARGLLKGQLSAAARNRGICLD